MNVNYNHTALSSGVKCSGSLHINELEVFKQFGSILAGACLGTPPCKKLQIEFYYKGASTLVRAQVYCNFHLGRIGWVIWGAEGPVIRPVCWSACATILLGSERM